MDDTDEISKKAEDNLLLDKPSQKTLQKGQTMPNYKSPSDIVLQSQSWHTTPWQRIPSANKLFNMHKFRFRKSPCQGIKTENSHSAIVKPQMNKT